MTYILFTGAPGSKWSSVVKNIYNSRDIDRSDQNDLRTYYHDADTPGAAQLMHMGAYWDPGMEFHPLETQHWAAPFSGSGRRVVKSHVFAHHLDWLIQFEHPIVMVYRNDWECYQWWQQCGEFNITYPNYAPYYKNLPNMWQEIRQQNSYILNFVRRNQSRITREYSNIDLCRALGVSTQGISTTHDYREKDITVYVYK